MTAHPHPVLQEVSRGTNQVCLTLSVLYMILIGKVSSGLDTTQHINTCHVLLLLLTLSNQGFIQGGGVLGGPDPYIPPIFTNSV